MNILIASGTYPPEVGGMATFVSKLAGLLDERGVGIKVIAYGEEDRTFTDPFPVQIISRRRSTLARYWQYFAAVKRLADGSDSVYAQDLVSSGLPAAVASRLSGKPLVLRLGGDFLWEKMVQQGKSDQPLKDYYAQKKSIKEKFYLWIYRFVLRQAHRVIFNTVYQAQLYNRYFPEELGLKKSAVILNPWSPRPDRTSREYRGDFVYLGRFIELKNLRRLIAAFSRVDTGSRKLSLIGDGPQRQELEEEVRRKQLKNVRILPPVSRERALEILSDSYALILPPLTELNPNVVLEALSVGTPVLLTAENGLPEAIKNKLEVFNPLSEDELSRKIAWILDPKNYEAYQQRLRQIKFYQTWDAVVEEHFQIFKALT